jgi:2,3-bisphosphoglycerate-dependent phosphoglycerate mutase
MELYFIRHAQSTNNALYAQGLSAGRASDPELTPLGERQAQLLADYVAEGAQPGPPNGRDPQNRWGFHFTHLYASLMVRSVHTGVVLASRLGLPLHAWVDWHEVGGIVLDAEEAGGGLVGQPGYNRAWFAQRYPALVLPDSLGEAGWWDSQPLEPEQSRTERARRVLADLLERHGDTDHRVAVISHGGFYNHFVAAFYGLEGRLPTWHLMNNTGISRFGFGQRENYVLYQNRLEHLPAELVTD